MKITAIKQQTKNPDRVNIVVDGKYSFSLTVDELLKHKLKKDQHIIQADIKKFKGLSAEGKLKIAALKWVMSRPHSVKEFQDYMRRKKTKPELATRLQTEFIQKGYLNDKAFATWLFEVRSKSGRSQKAIRAELLSKGIDRSLVSEILADDNSEAERLRLLIAKKKRLARYERDPDKLVRYLIGQGFSYQLVKDLLSET